MPNVILEHVIMLPVLIIVMVTFIPLTSFLSTSWTTSRVQTGLQDSSRQLADTISQLYFALNQSQISPGIVRQATSLPTNIENFVYTATGSTSNAGGSNSVKTLQVSLSAWGGRIIASTSVPLGVNVKWVSSLFTSNSATASVLLQKFANGTVAISFG